MQRRAVFISIHAPRTGSDQRIHQHLTFANRFQSTLPARGATANGVLSVQGNNDFNPRSPHGERRIRCCTSRRGRYFNPRSPHGERLVVLIDNGLPIKDFNPRSPHGERRDGRARKKIKEIYFNPRSPHGERPLFFQHLHRHRDFNPRSPHGERQTSPRRIPVRAMISIHAPRTGSDTVQRPRRWTRRRFQSTLPARGATTTERACSSRTGHFNPRSPHGERPPAPASWTASPPFQSTLPARGATERRPLLLR